MSPRTSHQRRPCWALVWLWILSIAQYAYRYILQVNDPRTTNYYDPTPAALSAIKYAILLGFGIYGAFRFLRHPVHIDVRFRLLAQITSAGLLLLGLILLVRTALLPGDFEETTLCATQFLPWLASVLLIPLIAEPTQSITLTVVAFERIAFWVLFPFWVLTVCFAATGIRYPALSYPGVIVRFGGILDDPNGYACLCLLLMVLAFGMRRPAWKSRTVIYGVMVAATLSLAGYATAFILGFCCVLFRIYRTKQSAARWLVAGSAASALILVVIAILPTIYNLNAAVELLGQAYATKGNSAAAHISDLLPTQSTLQESSPAAMLFGTGGFSENFYWRILSNFGVLGLVIVAGLSTLWCWYGINLDERWRRSLSAWNIAVLVGSNGIAYLLTFPLGLIYWSALAFVLYCGGSNQPGSTAAARHVPKMGT